MRESIVFIFSFLLGIGGGTLGFVLYFFSNIYRLKDIRLFKKVDFYIYAFLFTFFLSSIFSPFRGFSLLNFLVLILMFIGYVYFLNESFDIERIGKFWDYFIFGTTLLAFSGITMFLYKGSFAETPFINKNGLGTILATTIPIIQWRIYDGLRKDKLWYYICLLINLIGLVLTMSQGAVISFIVGELLLFVFGDKKIKKDILKLMLLGILILSGFLIRSLIVKDNLFNFFKTRLDPTSSSKTQRILIWKASWKMFLDHPITGVGFGTFSKVYPLYRLPEAVEENMAFAHNLPLNLLAETGIFGFLGFISVIIRTFVIGIKKYLKEKNVFTPFGKSSFTIYMTHQMFDGTMWSLHLGMIFFVLMAFLSYTYEA